MRNYLELVSLTDEELAKVDPLVMNLLVATSIPSLCFLDIEHYQELRDEWAAGVKARLPHAERVFQRNPERWKNDVNFLRLAILCEYLDRDVGIAYNEDQREVKSIRYTNPSDLFLNGVMDTKRGTCGNMSTLHVAIGWRLGWPVSLAVAKEHKFCRYDDGKVQYNIEATDTGRGGFAAPTDEEIMRKNNLPPKAVSSGSDLRAVTPRELLGLFVGMKARHMIDCARPAEAELEYLLARRLFPRSRSLYLNGTWASIQRSVELFEADEKGNPRNLADTLIETYGRSINRHQVAYQTDHRTTEVKVGYTFKL